MIEPLQDWIGTVHGGRALDLGAGDGKLSRWLVDQGFVVDAVDRDSSAYESISEVGVQGIHLIQQDLRSLDFPPVTYSVVAASSVLHFLLPSELLQLINRIVESLLPGGILACQVLTQDDPEYAAFIAGDKEQIEPDTFPMPEEGAIHYFASGELPRLCSDLETLHYSEERHSDRNNAWGYRAWAVLIARKPNPAPG